MPDQKQPEPMTLEVGGLTEPVPELSFSDTYIPPPGAVFSALQQVVLSPQLLTAPFEIVGGLSESIFPDFEAGQ